MLTGKYFYPLTVKQSWSICAELVNLCLLDIHGPCRSVWHVHGMGPGRERWAFQRENGNFSPCWGMMEQDCRSWRCCSDPGAQQCLSSVPGLQWSWAEHHSLHLSCPLPQAGWAVCLGTPQCVMILICSLQSQGGCLQAGRLLCQRLCFHTFYFGGLNRKHVTVCGCWVNHCGVTNVGIVPAGYLAELYILPGGACSALLEKEVKRQKRMVENIWDPMPCSGISVGMTGVAASLFPKLGYFYFQISHVDYCIFLNWFFTYPAQMGC